ncbi:flagellar hook protein FlgE [Desulfovulcanus sp.]
MGLSAALYSGTSGLRAHGEAMSVIGNNIANVSTVGFKGSRMHFEDALSQEITTAAGVGQVGRGVGVGAVLTDFAQGSLETTTEATDLAIGGNGFFVVSPKGEEVAYYTRAGNFRFDKDGYLVDPHGYVLQGWEVIRENTASASSVDETDNTTGVKTRGVSTDIHLENFQSPPQETSRVDMIVNLDSQSEDNSVDSTNPYFAMFNNWDATQSTPLGDTTYAYQSTIKVYDENGTSHNLTIYFDPVRDDLGDTGGRQMWEFMVTVPPDEDNRSFWSTAADTTKKGVLMIGSLSFNSAGELESMSAYTLQNVASGDDPSSLAEWLPADFSQNGYPICTPNFLGTTGADYTSDSAAKNIEINFGLRNKTTSWTLSDGNSDGSYDALDLGTTTDPQSIITFETPEYSANATTTYSSGSTTIYQSQDGYTAGFLQNVSVDRDGVVTGRYSNGQILPLYVITMADFNNKYALRREGGNLFSETRQSGPALTGPPGTAGKGTISSNSLEQSNVDLSTEFVKMITTEKGFQANSKTITTTDTMLATIIQMKR